MSAASLERALAQAALRAYADPPRPHYDLARRHFVDCAGVAIAGAPVAASRAVFAALPPATSKDAARVIGTTLSMAARDAAIANGMSGHFHDYDDDDPAISIGHPTVAVFAAICALAESTRVSIDSALATYIAGVETTLCVGRAVNPQHYDAGWHATASLGLFGATMAASLLLDLDDERIAHALGIAASMSAGIKCNFGSDVKPLQVGLAAGNGVLAAQLAKNGVRASDGALFGPTGFANVYSGRGDARAAVAAFGNPFGFERPGFNIKVYPCCSSTHTAIDGMLEILHDDGVKADAIAAIEVAIGPDVPAMLKYDVPRSPLEGKFSMRYCVAAAALRGELDLDSFTPEALVDRGLVAMLERVRVVVDPTLPRIPTGVTHCARVRVTLADGSTRQRQIGDPLGSAARPIALDRLRRKFVGCATPVLGIERAAEAFDTWIDADGETPLAAWIRRLCKDAPR